MYVITVSNKKYRYESPWRRKKGSDEEDDEGNRLPFPKTNNKHWNNQSVFLYQLGTVEKYVRTKNGYVSLDKSEFLDCHICGQKKVRKGHFTINKMRWYDELFHYIQAHGIKPSDEFTTFMFEFREPEAKLQSRPIAKIKGTTFVRSGIQYLKVERNQIHIMDALLKHGSYNRKYVDKENRKILRYSEHAGLLDFNNNGLEKVIIAGNTTRVDKYDDSIFMPQDIPNALDYEYIFHTHPATPNPGGRAEDGIVYEMPSMSDLFHFLDHYNGGKTQGSLVLAPEGMYNIRKLKMDNKKIRINEDNLYNDYQKAFNKIQDIVMEKYGTTFTPYVFYSQIAQEKFFMERINKVMNKYKMHIDFYHRIRDSNNRWIIDNIYLPVYVVEIKK